MSVRLYGERPVPDETARVARRAFPKGNSYMIIRDTLGCLFTDAELAPLYSSRGSPAISPATLALATIVQFAECLSDRQMAESVRARIDLKYLMGLELTDPGFDYSVLCEFRKRLIEGGKEMVLLDRLLERFKELNLLKGHHQQRTDSTHVLATVRKLNRLELVGETMRHMLEDLSGEAPDWLLQIVEPEWFNRYERRFELSRLPRKDTEREALQIQIGQDGYRLLTSLKAPDAPAHLRERESVRILSRVWEQQYELVDGEVGIRSKKNAPPYGEMIFSPFDPEARNRTKRDMNWTGYLAHLTEICADDELHILTNVETTSCSVGDNSMTSVIHHRLAEKGLLPNEHFVDAAYIDAALLVSSRTEHGVDLVGPTPPDNSWQTRTEGGLNVACFTINWAEKRITCPQAKESKLWRERKRKHGQRSIEVHFSRADCPSCPTKARCTKADHRVLRIRPREEFEALQEARLYQNTAPFRERYKRRAGVEGTISEGVRSHELRRTRYAGLAKTHLAHIATTAAINLSRYVNWVTGVPIAQTRISKFKALAPAA